MNDEDLQKLLKELQTVDVQLPLHRRALREHILEVQAERMHAKPRSIIAIGAQLVRRRRSMSSRRILSIGAVIIVVGVLLTGLLLLLPISGQPPAKKLIAEAAEKVGQMSPGKVAAISKTYDDINDHLNDAKNSDTTRIVSAAEMDEVVDPEVQEANTGVEVYVTYTDDDDRTVVIGLDDNNEPLVVVDVRTGDKATEKAEKLAAKTLAKEAKQEVKALAQQEKDLIKTAKALEKDARKGAQSLLD